VTLIADGVHEIDTRFAGWEHVTAGYLLDGDELTLIETGSQTSAPALVAALDELGVDPGDLAHIVVTHIHLDHAGGVGDIARAFPRATVHVHEKGARHLIDPSRLLESSARVFGDLLDELYGRMRPTEASRVHVLTDGEELRLAPDRVLTTVDSPGHAKHHLALHDGRSGLLFVGDAVGVRLPGMGFLRPATPPPDFDLDLALRSIERFAERRPTGLALAHYGLVAEPTELLAEATETLTRWAEIAVTAWREGRDVTAALDEAFRPEMDVLDELQRERLETLNGIHSNASGFRRWLDQGGHVHSAGHQH